MSKPITPYDASVKKSELIPDVVIDAFNDAIVENVDSMGQAQFVQSVVIDKIISGFSQNGSKVDRQEIFERGWLDVEPIFESAGWLVSYHKQGIGDSGESYFTFTDKS